MDFKDKILTGEVLPGLIVTDDDKQYMSWITELGLTDIHEAIFNAYMIGKYVGGGEKSA